jgi:hypothetical protein
MKKCLLLTVLLGLFGCASGPQPDLPQEVRDTLGTIGVMSRDSPAFDYSTPTTGGASGAGVGLKMWAVAASNCNGCGLGAGLLPVFLPFFALGGAIYGGVAGESSEAVATAETNLKEAFAEMKVQDVIRDHVYETARDRTRHSLVLLQPTDQPGHGGEPLYSALVERGVTTVLEVRVSQIALVAQAVGHNPPMSLVMIADAKLIRSKDGQVFYALSLEDRSLPRQFLAWGANSGQELRDVMTRLSQNLADQIVGKVFSTDLLPPVWPPTLNPTGENDAVKTEDRGTDQSTPQE